VTRKTESEALFEQFCSTHRLAVEPIPRGDDNTPDYLLRLGEAPVYVEIKQIDIDDSFGGPNGVSSRTIGDHVRAKINEARKQLQARSKQGSPCVLLVYNNLDPLQAFGTEEHDFITAMYGEWTVRIASNAIVDSYLGRNARLRPKHNSSFSAVGHLRRTSDGASVLLYENLHARHPLDYEALPKCFEVRRFEDDPTAGAETGAA
jgi:hypothetical protein